MSQQPIQVPRGARGQIQHTVVEADTAAAIGSGDVPVLGTPRLLALAESATLVALAGRLGPDRTSVGTRVELEHLLPTPVGGAVTVTADVEHVDGRLVRFAVSALDATGRLVAHGKVTRIVIERERFLSRL